MLTTERGRFVAFILCAGLVLSGAWRGTAPALLAQSRPNIVLMFPDNLGWGEVGVYGGVRGQLTPRIDKMAGEGIRLNNFNVEFSCTVSRAALMTGRYAIRSGATQPGGITLWEVTLAEALKSVGYATGLFGKWHLGGDRPEGKREPIRSGLRRVLRHPAHQQRSADDDRAGADDAWHVVHLGRQDRRAVAERQAVRHGHAPHRRS